MVDSLPADEPTACAVCAEPLFAVGSGGMVVGWVHSVELADAVLGAPGPGSGISSHRELLGLDPVDHLAFPVSASTIATALKCDFCSALRPRWVLPVAAFEAEGSSTNRFGENWMACDPCARLLRRERWDGLVRRAVDNAAATYGVNPSEPMLVAHISALHAQVREHQAGPVRRVSEILPS